MRILVTGGMGFVGSNLCQRLLQEGHSVTCVDNLYTGRRENLAAQLRNPALSFIQHDVQNPIQLEVDQIYHLACPASPPHYQADPIRTMKTAFLGTLNMLELARSLRVPILVASTSEVYGDPEVHPQREDYWGHVNPVGVRSCYDEGKRAGEALAADFRRFHGVDSRIIRIFNTYGPRMSHTDGRVVSNLIVQALQNRPLTIYGQGTQTRSFCYVDDLVDGMVRVMAAESCPGPINLGNPAEVSMLEFAGVVLELTGSSSEIAFRTLPQDDPTRRRPDITQARTALGWEPKVSLRDGLTATIRYFKQVLADEARAG